MNNYDYLPHSKPNYNLLTLKILNLVHDRNYNQLSVTITVKLKTFEFNLVHEFKMNFYYKH